MKIEKTDFAGGTYFGIRQTVPLSIATNQDTYREVGEKIFTYFDEKNIQPIGPMTTFYYAWNQEEGTTDFAITFPVKQFEESELEGTEFTLSNVSPQIALKYVHTGGYEKMFQLHQDMGEYLKEQRLEMGGFAVEEYEVNPKMESDPSKWVTNIYYTIKSV